MDYKQMMIFTIEGMVSVLLMVTSSMVCISIFLKRYSVINLLYPLHAAEARLLMACFVAPMKRPWRIIVHAAVVI